MTSTEGDHTVAASDNPIRQNRDFIRTNRATTTVQANIMSLITRDSILAAQTELKSELKRKYDTTFTDDATIKSDRKIRLLDIALNGNYETRSLFNKSQRAMTKQVAERYSNSQHNLMIRSVKFGEEISTVESISQSINVLEVSDMYKFLVGKFGKQSLSEQDGQHDTNKNENRENNVSDNMSEELMAYLKVYCTPKLPIIGSYPTPYTVAKFLVSHEHNHHKWNGYSISKWTLIQYLTKTEFVPLQKSSIYRICDLFKSDCVSPTKKWSEVTQPGSKSLLSPQGFNLLVTTIQNATLGGISLPLSKVKKLVEDRIKVEWYQNHKDHTVPRVSKSSLYTYANMIMAQKTFNIYHSISRKTESRHAAEWSFRSAIAFAMTVGATHFLPDVEASPFHRTKKEVSDDGKELWDLVEQQYSKIYKRETKCIPVLPHLVTSTDETTIFATDGMINPKEKIYLTARPTEAKNEHVDSGKRNDYCTDTAGDAHCRGIRIVLNTTFTAGGLTAPLFVTIYGLSPDEMPENDIVSIPIKGFTPGSERDLNSTRVGYVTFVRGQCDYFDENTEENSQEGSDTTHPISKEARVAKLFRTTVYHPFISDIRTNIYDHDPSQPIPENQRAVSWMDGANTQLKLITSEEMMELEEALKITSCKQSAARTSLEQAADAGPNFKNVKKNVKTMPNPHPSTNHIYRLLEKELKILETNEEGSGNIVRLKSHKKKAIMSTLPKLPEATGSAYTIPNVMKGFIYNGQVDADTIGVPSFSNLLNTYRGNVSDTCLADRPKLMNDFFEVMQTDGYIPESFFSTKEIPVDRNSKNEIVERSDDISSENRHRAKILTSSTQRKARRRLIDQKRIEVFKTKNAYYQFEEEEMKLNEKCERKLIEIIVKSCTPDEMLQYSNQSTNANSEIPFERVKSKVTIDLIQDHSSTFLKNELRAFVRVRSKRSIRRGKVNFADVPSKKQLLIQKCVSIKNKGYTNRLESIAPVRPVLLEPENED